MVSRGRRQDVELLVQPADRAVLPCGDGRPVSVLDLRRAAGHAARRRCPSRTDYRSITQRDWREIAAGGESGYIVPDPKRSRTSSGAERVGRFDWSTLQEQDVDPDARVSRRVPRRVDAAARRSRAREPTTIYFGNQFLFRSDRRRASTGEGEPRPDAREPGRSRRTSIR